jgi:hypothetical protein
MKGKTLTTRTSKSGALPRNVAQQKAKVASAKAQRTTKTPDGGQLAVRGGVGTKQGLNTAQAARDRYTTTGSGSTTKNPKLARGLSDAVYFNVAPNNPKLAKRMGDIAAKYAEKSNAITREYGDKKRR